MLTEKHVAVVGSRAFQNYLQLKKILDEYLQEDDIIVSGGAIGVDSMAQRYAKERGIDIIIFYPKYNRYGRGATFVRNEKIVAKSNLVLAFYAIGRFQQGGTANSVGWAQKLNVPYLEFEESI